MPILRSHYIVTCLSGLLFQNWSVFVLSRIRWYLKSIIEPSNKMKNIPPPLQLSLPLLEHNWIISCSDRKKLQRKCRDGLLETVRSIANIYICLGLDRLQWLCFLTLLQEIYPLSIWCFIL